MRVLRIIIYIVFFLVSLIYFLVELFPSREVAAYISSKVSSSLPGKKLSIGRIEPTFSPGIRLSNISVVETEREAKVLSFREAIVAPSILDLFAFRLGSEVLIRDSAGEIKARVSLRDSKNLEGSLTATLKNIDIYELSNLERFELGRIRGIANGTLEFKGTFRNVSSLTGGLDLNFKDLGFPLKNSLFGLSEVRFESGELKGVLDAGILRLQKFVGRSKEIACEISGEILLKDNLSDSGLNLKANWDISPKFVEQLEKNHPGRGILEQRLKRSKRITMNIVGTISKPAWQLR